MRRWLFQGINVKLELILQKENKILKLLEENVELFEAAKKLHASTEALRIAIEQNQTKPKG